MKKIIALLLALTAALSLCACAPKQEESSSGEGLKVGYGKVNVSPSMSLPLEGYQGNDAPEFRWSTSVEMPFFAICVAFTDANDNTVLLITVDMLNAYMADGMREGVSGITGVPKENIMFHCTHNHSGMSVRYKDPAVSTYLNELTQGVINASQLALNDRKPVTQAYSTFARPERTNSVRHYLLADGSYQSYGVGSVPKANLIGHYSVADNLLQVMKFSREGGKDVVLVNWQGHPPGTDPNTIATSNYPGVLRNYLDTNLGCDSVFFLGGSGNLNNSSQFPGEIRHSDYQGLGENLGIAAVEAAANFVPLNTQSVLIKEKKVGLANRNGGVQDVYLYAISLGDMAFVTAPFEIFDNNAVAVREASKYKMTFYLSCTNGSNGYLPTPPSFDWAITYESRTTKFPKGTAEIVQAELTDMLSDLYTQTGNTPEEKPEGYLQPEFVPKTDDVIYENPNPGNMDAAKPVQNGFYALQLKKGSSYKNMLTNDMQIANKIMQSSSVKLIFNEQNVIVGIVE